MNKMTRRELLIKASDKYIFSEEYVNIIKDSLIKNPEALAINFLTYTSINTCKRKFIARNGVHHTYEIMICIDIEKLKKHFNNVDINDVDVLSKVLRDELYKGYKHYILFH